MPGQPKMMSVVTPAPLAGFIKRYSSRLFAAKIANHGAKIKGKLKGDGLLGGRYLIKKSFVL
jgi:hypothetical protein